MALSRNIFLVLILGIFIPLSLTAPPRSVLDSNRQEVSTTVSLLDSDDEENGVWDEDDDDQLEFNFDGEVWMRDTPSRPTLEKTDPSLPELDEASIEDSSNNIVHEAVDGDDEEMDEVPSKQSDSQQDFLLLPPSDDGGKRDTDDPHVVRHTGHNPSSSQAFVVNEVFDDEDDDTDHDDDVIENYDLPPYSENDVTDSEIDDDVFGDEDEAESKRLFEDKVFLF